MEIQMMAHAFGRKGAANVVESERRRGGHGLCARLPRTADRRQFKTHRGGRRRMGEGAD